MSSPEGQAEGSVLLGKLRLDRVIGRGGMGTVFQAHHLKMDEAVAVKILQPDLVRDQVCVERFLREARASARIAHPNCIQVRDVDQLEDGTPFMVMELLNGESLFDRMKRGPLSLTETIAIMDPACAALGAAHRLGIVHRDFKPGNIQIAEKDGVTVVKVLDFGISKVPSRAATALVPRLTDPIRLLGSPKYMSPEQMASPGEVGPEADVWAIGCILYRALTGVPPFDGANVMDICHAVLQAEPVDPRQIDPWIPDWMADLIARCLEKEPARRLGDANVVREALRREGGFYPVQPTEKMSTPEAKKPEARKGVHVKTVPLAAVSPAALAPMVGAGGTVPNATLPRAAHPSARPDSSPTSAPSIRQPMPSSSGGPVSPPVSRQAPPSFAGPASLGGGTPSVASRASMHSDHPLGMTSNGAGHGPSGTAPLLARGSGTTPLASPPASFVRLPLWAAAIVVVGIVVLALVIALLVLDRSSAETSTKSRADARRARATAVEPSRPDAPPMSTVLAATRDRFQREGFAIERDRSDPTADYLSVRRESCHATVSAIQLPPQAMAGVVEKSEPENGLLVFAHNGRAFSFYVTWSTLDPQPWCSVASLRSLIAP